MKKYIVYNNWSFSLFFSPIAFIMFLRMIDLIWLSVIVTFILTVLLLRQVSISEHSVDKTSALFYKQSILTKDISKVIYSCIPRNVKGGYTGSPLYIYSKSGQKIVVNCGSPDDPLGIKKVKKYLTFLDNKGVEIKLFVDFGRDKDQFFKGFEVVRNID